MAKAAAIASGGVNSHISDSQPIAAGNADSLNRGVLDRNASDARTCQTVEREKLQPLALIGA